MPRSRAFEKSKFIRILKEILDFYWFLETDIKADEKRAVFFLNKILL